MDGLEPIGPPRNRFVPTAPTTDRSDVHAPTSIPAYVTFRGLVGFGLLGVGTAAMGHGDFAVLGGLLFLAGLVVTVVALVRGNLLYRY